MEPSRVDAIRFGSESANVIEVRAKNIVINRSSMTYPISFLWFIINESLSVFVLK